MAHDNICACAEARLEGCEGEGDCGWALREVKISNITKHGFVLWSARAKCLGISFSGSLSTGLAEEGVEQVGRR